MIRDNYLAEVLSLNTIRIETYDSNNNPNGTGTGFYFNFFLDDARKHYVPCIVTNKHVVENAKKAKVLVNVFETSKTPNFGEVTLQIYQDSKVFRTGQTQTMEIPEFEEHCIFHPDSEVDLCIYPFAAPGNENIVNVALDNDNIPTIEDVGKLNAIEDILMVGYPNGLWDEYNNQPLFRTGSTASHPAYNYNNRNEFVIDCACYPGSSGSPVMLHNFGKEDREEFYGSGKKILFLGILYSGPLSVAETNVDKVYSKVMMNLGNVIKSSELLAFVDILKTSTNYSEKADVK
ncbi:S1 family peptidase [Aquibacillus sediminis]|uniref:S1 family peptidase n=1 Tax=Aquibacillus sediminis TaxID=2574734 RepID=UPI001107E8D1|nr:serine protease [Aquibacillus sediminis]